MTIDNVPEAEESSKSIEIGWILAEGFRDVDRRAIVAARDALYTLLSAALPDETNLMFSVDSVEQLDAMKSFDAVQLRQLTKELGEVADLRLEESRRYRGLRPGLFYLLATWVNRQEILKALAESKPWYFPLRFGRLTAAAASGLLYGLVQHLHRRLGRQLRTAQLLSPRHFRRRRTLSHSCSALADSPPDSGLASLAGAVSGLACVSDSVSAAGC